MRSKRLGVILAAIRRALVATLAFQDAYGEAESIERRRGLSPTFVVQEQTYSPHGAKVRA